MKKLFYSFFVVTITCTAKAQDAVDIWNLPPLNVEQGRYTTDWNNLSRQYNTPSWWREAKLGAWSHWDPQSMAEDGDWYSLHIYNEDHPQAEYHRKHFGHPTEYGYKELCRDWKTDRWDPEDLMNLYEKMGARYFLALGNHHDNFDCWESKYQPWNSVNIGPHQDIVGIWEGVARKHDMPFGIGFHATPARTWGQFMPPRYKSDMHGDKAGIPYDAMLTKVDGYKLNADGTEKWWKGMDPQDLYGPVHHNGRNSLESPFANQFMWRVDDAIRKYQPDMIYFDDHAGDSQIDLGIDMGLGKLTPQIIANFYNIADKRTEGRKEVVATFKGVGGRYNSFQNHPEMVGIVDRSLVKSTELYTEDDIMAFPFQTEVSLQEWHYQQGAPYRSAEEIITRLMQNVSRNGCLLLNITQHGRGNIDDEARQICLDIGRWIDINKEAIYSARPFHVWGNEEVIYTRQGGYIYATIVNPNNEEIVLPALSDQSPSVGKIKKVELVESGQTIPFRQSAEGLTIRMKQSIVQDISDQQLAKGYKVIRITHNKAWFNDDDPGIRTVGWDRRCKTDQGDFNNDLSFSNQTGDTWTAKIEAGRISIVAPQGMGEGVMEILIDGKHVGEVSFVKNQEVKHQSVVFVSKKLSKGKHEIQLKNKGGLIAIDAIIIQ
ncbi:MAG: alpha-L-fucosidase [Bacteroidaceae bacterium]|nr:alpha-L-fucosidase [Bacteroidaceae bacterium]